MASKAKSGKKVAAAPKDATKAKASQKKTFNSEHAHLFQKDPKDFRIGRDFNKARDVSRFVKWPTYVRIQRQRAILHQRLKVPPAIHQFAAAMDKNQAKNVLSLLSKYKPETAQEKKARRQKAAEAQVKEQKSDEKKPRVLKYGLSHITKLVEEKKARLVVIAHDVDPIELVLWLPALCRKMDVPYCIIKGKARLGHLVHKKTATAVALTEVKKEDQAKLDQILQSVKLNFNDNVNVRKNWGGGIMGVKAQEVQKQRVRAVARAQATKEKSKI
jgi:large subunit ribosomal protein L7Ae